MWSHLDLAYYLLLKPENNINQNFIFDLACHVLLKTIQQAERLKSHERSPDVDRPDG